MSKNANKKMEEVLSRDVEILRFINKHTKEKGWPPTVREIQTALDISSTSVVSYHINSLKNDGYLVKTDEQQARALALTPDGRMHMESS